MFHFLKFPFNVVFSKEKFKFKLLACILLFIFMLYSDSFK